MMKEQLANIIANTLYGLGHLIFRMTTVEVGYPIVDKLMSYSYRVQMWGNAKEPWQ